MNRIDIANAIARDIFEFGDEPADKVQRIEFKGGSWPNNETNLGGLDESALASAILVSLIRLVPFDEKGQAHE